MTRAPIKLSREMKLLLLLLLMVGLIGLWYVLTNKPSSTDLSQQPTPPTTGSGTGSTGAAPSGTAAGATDTVPVTPPTSTATAGSADSGTALPVQPDSQVQVETIPPFPTDGQTAATPAPEPAAPTGINPDGVITATPGANPFKPLSLDANAGSAAGGTPNVPATTTATTRAPSTTQVTAAVPAQPVTPAVDSLGTTGGALGLSPIPGADGTVDVASGSVSGGALPVPVIPGADGSGGTAATPVVVPVTPTATVGGATGSAPSTGSAPAGTVVLTAPAKPPVVGVNVPGTVAGLPAGTATPAATSIPTPGTPQVIRDLAATTGASTPGTAVSTLSALDQYVQNQNLVFNAVVLGPINTAIFRGKSGYVVVASGQPLPDSKVVVGDVTATSATLRLGTDSKTLELDKR